MPKPRRKKLSQQQQQQRMQNVFENSQLINLPTSSNEGKKDLNIHLSLHEKADWPQIALLSPESIAEIFINDICSGRPALFDYSLEPSILKEKIGSPVNLDSLYGDLLVIDKLLENPILQALFASNYLTFFMSQRKKDDVLAKRFDDDTHTSYMGETTFPDKIYILLGFSLYTQEIVVSSVKEWMSGYVFNSLSIDPTEENIQLLFNHCLNATGDKDRLEQKLAEAKEANALKAHKKSEINKVFTEDNPFPQTLADIMHDYTILSTISTQPENANEPEPTAPKSPPEAMPQAVKVEENLNPNPATTSSASVIQSPPFIPPQAKMKTLKNGYQVDEKNFNATVVLLQNLLDTEERRTALYDLYQLCKNPAYDALRSAKILKSYVLVTEPFPPKLTVHKDTQNIVLDAFETDEVLSAYLFIIISENAKPEEVLQSDDVPEPPPPVQPAEQPAIANAPLIEGREQIEANDIPQDDVSSSDSEGEEDDYIKKALVFDQTKALLREQFLTHIGAIKGVIQRNPKYQQEGQDLYDALEKAQDKLLNDVSIRTHEDVMLAAITDFIETCEQHIKTADKIMGHNWLYRIGEIFLKGVGALLAGIGITVLTLGIGWASKDIRHRYKDTFFTLNQTPESEALQDIDLHKGAPPPR